MELFIKSYGSYKPGNRNERARCPGQGRSSCPGLRCISTCLSLTIVWVLFLWNRHLSYGRIGWQWNSRPLKGQEATDRSRGSPGTLSGGITRKEADLEKCNHAHSSHGVRHYFDIAWDPEEEICVFCGILFPGIIASNVLCVICIC